MDQIPHDVLQAMMNCDWPGNIRELQSLIERGVIVSFRECFARSRKS